jgi:lysophospholipase L1-like esterase
MDGRATIKLNAGKVSTLELYYQAQPKGGTVTLTADGTEVAKVDTKAEAKAAAYATATRAAGMSTFKIETSGRAKLFGIDLENDHGAVVDNLGIVSVNVKSFNNADQTAWIAQLAHRNADLVMIMIGANEAQWLGPNDKDTKDYATNYGKVLASIRKGRPDGACLVVSPTDQAEAKDGAYPSRPVMPPLVAAQKQAAQAAGCAFFSTYDWMGGKGSASKWFAKGLVGSDFQHLSKKGANKLADAIYDALLTGYQRYAGH